jgi:CRISPR-associated protein Csm4
MQWYDLILRVQTALGTLLSADSLFGHLCWGIRYRQSEQALGDFLAGYESGSPPLLLSDPVPVGFWPLPHLPRPVPEMEEKLKSDLQKTEKACLEKQLPICPVILRMKGAKPDEVDTFDILKWMFKLRWLPQDVLTATMDQFSMTAILEYFLKQGCGQPTDLSKTVVAHNTINRLSGTTGDEGSFFFTEELHIDPTNPPLFHLLVGSGVYSAGQIRDLFDSALEGGYGKYKSRGKGKVVIESVEPVKLPAANNPNAVMLLSACAPAAEDPTEGYWKLHTKSGRLGGDWAVGPHPSGKHNPYKKPLTILTAGSVFKTAQPRPFYGRLVAGIHANFKEVRHYGLAPAIPVCLVEEALS